MATITDLAAYKVRMEANPQPTDKFILQVTRSVRDWMLGDLREREKNLRQATTDTKIKPAKLAKRQRELAEIEQTIRALEKARQIS